MDLENDEFLTANGPLVLHIQKTWGVSAGGDNDIASWTDADSREPANHLCTRQNHGSRRAWIFRRGVPLDAEKCERCLQTLITGLGHIERMRRVRLEDH